MNQQANIFWLRPTSKLWHPDGHSVLDQDQVVTDNPNNSNNGYSKPKGTRYFTGEQIIHQANTLLPPRINVELDRKGASVVDIAALATVLSELYPTHSSTKPFYRIADPDEVAQTGNANNAATLVLILNSGRVSHSYHSGSLEVELNLRSLTGSVSNVGDTQNTHLFIPTSSLRVQRDTSQSYKVVLSVSPDRQSSVLSGDYQPKTKWGLSWNSLKELVSEGFTVNSGDLNYQANRLPEGIGALYIAGKTIGVDAGIGQRTAVYGIPLAYFPSEKKS